ncbi:MAG: hypothetical protein J5770_03120 [Bacteroidaceae bacterium]|nr:hypothetical protein [Bacteroidaceae bacterium]
MKKFFTLIAVALVAGSAFAQEVEVVKGTFTRNSNSNEEEMAPFKSTEWLNGEQVAVVQSRVVVDPTLGYADESEAPRTANRCIEVISRDAPVDEETGEVTNIDAWDTQFFIQVPEPWDAGTQYTVKFKYRAEKPASASTQAHALPSRYNDHGILGNISFTEEWQDFEQSGTLTAAQAQGNGGQFQSIAFNLAEFKEANKYYFDDISITMIKPKENVWVNIYENDGTDLSTVSVKYFRNYTDEAKSVDGAIVVTSLDPEKDYTGTYYYSNDADTEEQPAVLGRDWDTQFLISLPMPLNAGQKFKFSMKYWADKDANTQTQAHSAAPAPGFIEGANHSGAGTYLWYSLAGDVAFTTEPQTKEWTVTVPDNAAGMQAICFNLDVLKEVNNYYFDDIMVYVDEDDVPTAINSFKAEKAVKTIYNVAGQQIKSLQKGLNIVNGEKVYVK